jgi:hypothetical protein
MMTLIGFGDNAGQGLQLLSRRVLLESLEQGPSE